MKHKQCSMCGVVYPASSDFFWVSKQHKDGLRSNCRKCCIAKKREYYEKNKPQILTAQKLHRDQNKDAILARERHRYHTDEDFRIRKLATNKRHFQKQSEKIAIYKQAWVERNRDKTRAASKRWREAHPLKKRADCLTRIARKRNAPGTFTKSDISRLYKMQGGKCKYCNLPLDGGYHLDHVIPISRGGTNFASNIVLACPSCNLSKGDKLIDEWNSPPRKT